MRDAQQRRLPPQLAGACQQLATVLAVESAAGLIEDDQPHPGAKHGPPESYALAFSARDQGASLAQPCPETVGQPLYDAA